MRRPGDRRGHEWAAVRPLLPVPAWLRSRGGQPEGYCHHATLERSAYLVDSGIKWWLMPVGLASILYAA
ncbi:hypothetical protein ACIBBE_24535 [Streptomyces sp. NPDC051644]|uniref:hypothetical protein n=1 Tax=Streptomyces sp. NPDC051644 TaxID=3365666 RepID=UPI0037971F4A